MTTDIEVYDQPAPASLTLFRSDDPTEVIEHASKVASALKQVVKKQRLIARIGQKDYPLVEAWTLAGTLLGVFPVCVWTRETVTRDGETGWEARVEARTRSGDVVGAAEAQCDRTEKLWANRDSYALRSMAQTRATSKALRMPLGFIMTLAGFEATPEEEMPGDMPRIDSPIVDPDGAAFPDERPVFDGEDADAVASGQFPIPDGAATTDLRDEKQGKVIFALYKAIEKKHPDLTVAVLKDRCEMAYGSPDDRKLSRVDAQEWIATLKEWEAS